MELKECTLHCDEMDKDFDVIVYGEAGRPTVVFPEGDASCTSRENGGMVEALSEFVEDGRIQLFCFDSVDSEGWYAHGARNSYRLGSLMPYLDYVRSGLLPFVSAHAASQDLPLVAGVGIGALNAALVMLRLGPRIGKEHMDARQRPGGDHLPQHFLGVMLDDPQVGQFLLLDQLQERPHAGRVHVDGDEIDVRRIGGNLGRGVAHAEADFENFWLVAAESSIQIDGGSLKIQAELRPVFVDSALLGGGHMALAQDEGFDAAPLSAVGGVIGLLGDVGHGVVFRGLGFQAAWGGLKQAA